MSSVDRSVNQVFADCRQAGRAALIGYLPAGFPTVPHSKELVTAMLGEPSGASDSPRLGCDIVEVGIPFSDPVLDGPTIASAGFTALRNGFRVRDAFDVVSTVAEAGGTPVVMTYWNPVHRYGVNAFARDVAAAGGCGVITPDLIPEEADEWLSASEEHGLHRIFLVAPSTSDERLALTAKASSGFVYAAAVMGVTGARESVGDATAGLVQRTRAHTDLPIGVGLGVSSGAQAAEIGSYADGVIVGSAFVSRAEKEGPAGVRAFAGELATALRD